MIAINKVVSVSYTLKAGKEGDEKMHIETADKTNPLLWIFGVGSMIPTFETNLLNKKVGDTFNFNINAEDGYGNRDEESVVMLPLDIFKNEDGKLDNEMLTVGNLLPMKDNEGHNLQGRVLEITAEFVKMDFNHPLAGSELHFEGEVLEIREATEEELLHGHVHGPGGHHHE